MIVRQIVGRGVPVIPSNEEKQGQGVVSVTGGLRLTLTRGTSRVIEGLPVTKFPNSPDNFLSPLLLAQRSHLPLTIATDTVHSMLGINLI